MLRHQAGTVLALVVARLPAQARQTPRAAPAPAATAVPNAANSPGLTLGNAAVRGPSANRPVTAAACNARAAAMPGSAGTLGLNGAGRSLAIVEVPLGGTNVASATQQRQLAEACARVRR